VFAFRTELHGEEATGMVAASLRRRSQLYLQGFNSGLTTGTSATLCSSDFGRSVSAMSKTRKN
jgi:hypothetical protein